MSSKHIKYLRVTVWVIQKWNPYNEKIKIYYGGFVVEIIFNL